MLEEGKEERISRASLGTKEAGVEMKKVARGTIGGD